MTKVIDIITYTGSWKDVDHAVRDFMDKYSDRVIELRYKIKRGSPRRLTVEIVYRVGGRYANW